ncbi:SCO family protein [Methylotetracoccus oryzae]|uniref:SCO family protein n=1 Tax=Methylotetracoccus oryzae TaxID=1919059 RepID=UPI00111999B4|nr:SCO family protein [Methylotetracoccus oryzae]
MNEISKRAFLTRLAGVSAGVAAVTAVPLALAKTADALQPELSHPAKRLSADERRRNRFPNVPVVDHEGNTHRFYDDLIKDKIVLVNFMFTRCNGTCPGTTANLKKVQAEFGDRMGRDVFLYSVSLDAEYDTVERLKAYAELFKVGPGWRFITGTQEDLGLIRRKFGLYRTDPVLDRQADNHVGAVKFGIERLERWGMCSAMTKPKYIARYVEWMEPNGRRPTLPEMTGSVPARKAT